MASTLNLARDLLEQELPNRWMHVQGVARRATAFHGAFKHERLELLIAAGFVHDIGYASPVHKTGFHPIDGARHLRSLGFDEDLVCLVAHHTCAAIEAGFHGLEGTMRNEFPVDPCLPHDELLYCDLSTSPTGVEITLDDRLVDIRARYGAAHVVSRFVNVAEPFMRAASLRAESKLHQHVVGPGLPQRTEELLVGAASQTTNVNRGTAGDV